MQRPTSEGLIALNAGSSSVKFALYATPDRHALDVQAEGAIEGIGTRPHFWAKGPGGEMLVERRWPKGGPGQYEDLVASLLAWTEEHLETGRLVGAGHRVVHGGNDFVDPTIVDEATIFHLERLVRLAPLHQLHSVALIRMLRSMHPELPQVACFDTAFHAGNSATSRRYGLPRALEAEGIRRYGFHGLSYEYISRRLRELDPKAAVGKTVAAHLGSGASLCAMLDGESVASSMGFSPLEGLVMGTRPGSLDPGIVLHLIRERKMSADAVEHMLYYESGLLGVSGMSAEMGELLASDRPGAREAVDLFVYRVVRELGSLAAAAQGLDALVFTAGIGERSPEIRAAVCRDSGWLGIALDEAANAAGGPLVSTPQSRVAVWVIPTDENVTIARHTLEKLRGEGRLDWAQARAEEIA
ncbi:MAG: acetate/propionate family kinase [Vulcanimicrobiaceae bacterium]